VSRARPSYREALDFADGLDLPDGAAMAMAEELSGGDITDLIEDYAPARDRRRPAPAVKLVFCPICHRKFRMQAHLDQHYRAKRAARDERHLAIPMPTIRSLRQGAKS
jgi:hypothetical protein